MFMVRFQGDIHEYDKKKNKKRYMLCESIRPKAMNHNQICLIE